MSDNGAPMTLYVNQTKITLVLKRSLQCINVSTESANRLKENQKQLKVSKKQNGFMKTSFLPKTHAFILGVLFEIWEREKCDFIGVSKINSYIVF